MAQYATMVNQSTFSYDETKSLFKTSIDLNAVTGFNNVQYNASAVKVMRYITETGGFKEVICHTEITADGILTIYAHEKFNLKVLIIKDL